MKADAEVVHPSSKAEGLRPCRGVRAFAQSRGASPLLGQTQASEEGAVTAVTVALTAPRQRSASVFDGLLSCQHLD